MIITSKEYDARHRKINRNVVLEPFCRHFVVCLCFSFVVLARPLKCPNEDKKMLQT